MDPRIASRSLRLLNLVLDTIGFFICYMIVGLIFAFSYSILADGNPDMSYQEEELILLVGIIGFPILYFLYYLIFEWRFQRTPGKWITGTMVVDRYGEKPIFKDYVIRTLARFIPFGKLSFLADNVGIHDDVSKTIVIDIRKKITQSEQEQLYF